MTIPKTLLSNILKALDTRDKNSLSNVIENLNNEIELSKVKVLETLDRIHAAKKLLSINQGIVACLLIARVKTIRLDHAVEFQYEKVVSNNTTLLETLDMLDILVRKYNADIGNLQIASRSLSTFSSELNRQG